MRRSRGLESPKISVSTEVICFFAKAAQHWVRLQHVVFLA